MTFREKLQTEHPEMVDKRFGGGVKACPYHYGYEKNLNCMVWESNEKCEECWNREMPGTELVKTVTLPMPPNTEPKEIKTKTDDVLTNDYAVAYEKGFEDGMSEGLTQGQNDAWELSRKLLVDFKDVTGTEFLKIFGAFIPDVYSAMTPQEALAKLKAYEEAQEIKVGDVVTNEERNVEILVTEIDDYERTFNGIKVTPTDELGNLGGVYTVMLMCRFKKTGKHIDIKSILEQIGE